MAIDCITAKMLEGDRAAIIYGFGSSSVVDRFNAMVCAVKYRLGGKETEDWLNCLTMDNTCLFGYNAGYRISDVALAALHLLGISEYQGTEPYVLGFIESKLDIY